VGKERFNICKQLWKSLGKNLCSQTTIFGGIQPPYSAASEHDNAVLLGQMPLFLEVTHAI
jgi:hypothetical protein